jgi:hypothetical protein
MSKYKNSILRELGISPRADKEQQDVGDLSFHDEVVGDIDNLNAIEKPMSKPSDRERMLSPTAIVPQVLAVAVRGSSTGGLPSRNNMTPGKLGGYEPIPTAKENSMVVDKTPASNTIDSSSPISKDEDAPMEPNGKHPHQVQNTPDQPPQAVTGASTEDDSPLQLKSALPQGIDIDVVEGEHSDLDKKASKDFRDALGKTLDLKEDIVTTRKLYAIRESLQEKAITGKMNKKESEVFRCITEVLQKRGKGLEKRLFGKKTILETAGVVSERELPYEDLVQTWKDDSSSGEYVSVNDKGDAYYQGELIVSADDGMNPDWKGIHTWANNNNYWPNVWVGNDHGNVDLYTINGKHLGGLV